jgi:RNA-binding protein
MEFPFSSAVVSVHAHATEDEQRVLGILKGLLPDSAEVRKSGLKGHHGNPIVALEARLGQKKDIKELWRRFLSGMREDTFVNLVMMVPERVDDSCFMYLRFDKQSAYGGELVLTDAGDAIHVRLKVSAFPADREVATGNVKRFLEAQEKHEA